MRLRVLPRFVGLFRFTMEDDSGHFRWIVEPRVQDGEARLELGGSRGFDSLTDAALDQIVRDVNAWYDARG